MKTLKTCGNVALILLATLSVIVMVMYAWFAVFVDAKTIGVNNISDQIAVDVKSADELSADELAQFEERWFMEANYYSNDKNNGMELQELNINYFTSHELKQEDYRATGMQYIGDFKYETVSSPNFGADLAEKVASSAVENRFYYYDTTDGISFNGYAGDMFNNSSVATVLNRDATLIIKIDNRPFAIQLDGERTTGWWIFGETYIYTYADLFEAVMQAIESNSAGYGDYYITLDLSELFSIRELSSDGKFLADNVTDIIKNYAVLKFHYDENGASRSSQSMFGKISNNSVIGEYDVDYWQERMVYTLSEKDLTYRYSETFGGYFVSFNLATKEFFEEMQRTKLLLNFDFSSLWVEEKGYNVIGFDYNSFEGFEIDTMTIKSAPKTLYVLDDAFKDCKLTTLKHSSGIVFEGFTFDNTEVIAL